MLIGSLDEDELLLEELLLELLEEDELLLELLEEDELLLELLEDELLDEDGGVPLDELEAMASGWVGYQSMSPLSE